ncbi:MAG: rane protein of unknown function [Verrucomicrobiales bacterium]|nr:rane protein of unknown function [Verrucomicrobiales bacterium]
MTTPIKSVSKSIAFENLDIVRGIAAASVFLHHYAQQFPHPGSAALSFFERLGGWGVTIFFVLSGFCIHWSEINNRSSGNAFNIKSYFVRRIFRIYPAFVVCLIVCLIISNYHTSNNINHGGIEAVFSHLSLTSSFSLTNRNAINTVLWTVVVEAHFYILYAIFQKYFNGLKAARRMVVISIVVSAITYVASVTFVEAGLVRVTMQKIFATSWWTWCLGAWAAEIIKTGHPLIKSHRLRQGVMACAIAGSLALLFLPPTYSLQAIRFILPIFVLIGMLLILKSQTSPLFKPLRGLGEVSYSLYLFHPVALLVGIYIVVNPISHFVLVMVMGLLIAVFGYNCIEKPFNFKGHRLAKKISSKKAGSIS